MFCGCWGETRDSWVRDRGLDFSRHGWCQHVCHSPGPEPCGATPRAQRGTAPEGFVPQLRSLKLGNPPLSQQAVSKPALCPGGRPHLVPQGSFSEQLGEMAQPRERRPGPRILGLYGKNMQGCSGRGGEPLLTPSASTLQ